jgi:hypothetical protein
LELAERRSSTAWTGLELVVVCMGGEGRRTVAGTTGLVDSFAIHFGGHDDDMLMELKLEIENNYKCVESGFDVIGSSRCTKCHSPSLRCR